MRVSLNIIKQFTKVDLPVPELIAKINGQLGGVEDVTDLAERYKDARIVRIVSCGDHPNADRLHVCKIDDGGIVKNVPRDDNGYVQVVCGAPNAREGIFVVWLPPASTVPASFDEKELFTLDARELRGVLSQGMLASPKELGLGDSHEGILELDPSDNLAAGSLFAEIYGLDDVLIDVENKMFTHRPDCFGQLGVAREIAGIQHLPFTSPDWYRTDPEFQAGEGLDLAVINEAIDSVPRFMAVVVDGVSVKPSPVWLQAELVRLGSKPINNIVDITNYMMLITGQPLHAYDFDKLAGATLGVRLAKKGETVSLLNGKTYELTTEDIVIVDKNGPVGLGGIMGGNESEVSETTTRIVLECATFDMYAVRKTSMRHGIFTDALTRFNKGQSPFQNGYVLAKALRMLTDEGGSLASHIFDIHDNPKPSSVETTVEFINDRLGLSLSADEIAALLKNVEFDVKVGKNIQISPPFWRTDISLPEDIVEEVGRLYGFDALPRVLPQRSISPAPHDEVLALVDAVRSTLASAGANEVLTYSFVHENVLRKAGQSPKMAFKLGNALSPDLQYYRLSVLPSLLDKVHANIKNGFDEFTLFEIGKGHHKENLDEEGLPREVTMVDAVYASRKAKAGAAFYRAARAAEHVLGVLGVDTVRRQIEQTMDYEGSMPFEPSRSALLVTPDGQVLGMVGELKSSVVEQFKLPEYTAAFTIDIASLFATLSSNRRPYIPLSRFPSVTQDISLRAPANRLYAEVAKIVEDTLGDQAADKKLTTQVEVISIYRPEDETMTTTTFRIRVTSDTKTLSDKDVTPIIDAVALAAKQLGIDRV